MSVITLPNHPHSASSSKIECQICGEIYSAAHTRLCYDNLYNKIQKNESKVQSKFRGRLLWGRRFWSSDTDSACPKWIHAIFHSSISLRLKVLPLGRNLETFLLEFSSTISHLGLSDIDLPLVILPLYFSFPFAQDFIMEQTVFCVKEEKASIWWDSLFMLLWCLEIGFIIVSFSVESHLGFELCGNTEYWICIFWMSKLFIKVVILIVDKN